MTLCEFAASSECIERLKCCKTKAEGENVLRESGVCFNPHGLSEEEIDLLASGEGMTPLLAYLLFDGVECFGVSD